MMAGSSQCRVLRVVYFGSCASGRVLARPRWAKIRGNVTSYWKSMGNCCA